MRQLLKYGLLLMLLLVAVLSYAQAPWNTKTNRPPAEWYPYPVDKSLWKQPIPSQCHGASMPSYCIINPSTYGLSGTASQFVNCALTKCGNGSFDLGQVAGNGASAMHGGSTQGAGGTHPWQVGAQDNGISLSYSQPGDPYYFITPNSGTCSFDSIGGGGGFDIKMAVQIPDQACWTGENNSFNPNGSDGQIGGFDQAQGILWAMARGGCCPPSHAQACLPPTGGGHKQPNTALAITGDVVGSSCTGQRALIDKDFGWAGGNQHYSWTSPIDNTVNTLGGGDGTLDQGASDNIEPGRLEEIGVDINNVVGQILRQTAGTMGCTTSKVYPASSNTFQCSGVGGVSNPNSYPPNGGRIYFDYTDAQLASMNLPPLQNNIMTHLSHQGSYPSVTNASANGWSLISGDAVESELAYAQAAHAHHPFWPWLLSQTLGSPNCNGSNCPSQTTVGACGISNGSGTNSEYSFNCNFLYGIPPIAGDTPDVHESYLLNHAHFLDPCVTALEANAAGGSVSVPAGCGALTIVNYLLTTIVNGGGSLTTTPANVNCPKAQCTAIYPSGTVVTVNATAGVTWSGACSGSGACNVTMNAAKSVTATFSAPQSNYYVNPSTGSDSNDGSQAHPWKTICHADASLGLGANGTTVNLAAGTYDNTNQLGTSPCASTYTSGAGHTSLQMQTTANGTASQRITFTGPSNYWKVGGSSAKIVGSWYSFGNYVDVWNVEITNPTGPLGYVAGQFDHTVNTKGNFDTFRMSYVHDIGNSSCADGVGATAVTLAYRVHDSVIDSIVVDKSDLPYGCPAEVGTGGYGLNVEGPHNTVTNNMVSNAEGGGLEVFGNVCNELIANNVFVHNGVTGLEIGGWDGITPNDCPTGNNTNDYTTVVGNTSIDNGWTCGAANSQGQGVVGAFDFYSVGTTSTHNTFAYNAGYNNWSATGNRNCINSPGINNTLALHNSADPLGINPETNLSGSGHSGLVVTFGDNVVPSVNPPLGGSTNFLPTANGPLHNAIPSTGNNFCAGSPGFPSPCIPGNDIVGVLRALPTSIGAYVGGSGNVYTWTQIIAGIPTGKGTVTTSPAGINCPPTCTVSFNQGQVVTATASANQTGPVAANQFIGWSGQCSGRGVCQVTMNQNVISTAAFAPTVIPGTFFAAGYNNLSASPPPPHWCPNDSQGAIAEFETVRLWDSGVHWSQLETSNNGYDAPTVAILDEMINTLAQNVSCPMQILYTIGDTPKFAGTCASQPDPSTCLPGLQSDGYGGGTHCAEGSYNCMPESDIAADGTGTDAFFKGFATWITQRYTTKVGFYEIRNEPDIDQWWCPGGSASGCGTATAGYKQLVRMGWDLRQIALCANPNVQIVSPSFHSNTAAGFMHSFVITSINAPAVTTSCGTVPAQLVTGAMTFDITNEHMYGGSPADPINVINAYNAAACEIDNDNLPETLIDDEFGWLKLLSGPTQAEGVAYIGIEYALQASLGNNPITNGNFPNCSLAAGPPIQMAFWYTWDTNTFPPAGSLTGTAYDTMAGWLEGSIVGAFTNNSGIYTIPVTDPLGNSDIIAFDNTKTCNPSCTYANHAFGSQYTAYVNLAGVQTATTGGNGTAPLGYQPILLIPTIAPPQAPTNLQGAVALLGAAKVK